MDIKDLIRLYEELRKKHGSNAHRHVSELLGEAKERHYGDWMKNPTPGRDHEQSWRSFKGKNFQKLVLHIIMTESRT